MSDSLGQSGRNFSVWNKHSENELTLSKYHTDI